MDTDLRIPVTEDQKRLISEAATLDESDMATWARPILVQAARDRIRKAESVRPARKSERGG